MDIAKSLSALMASAKRKKKKFLHRLLRNNQIICLIALLSSQASDLDFQMSVALLRILLKIQCMKCKLVWLMKSAIWLMLSSILERCQLWTLLMVRFKNNLSKAQVRVRWEETEKCILLKRNLAIKLSATTVIANK